MFLRSSITAGSCQRLRGVHDRQGSHDIGTTLTKSCGTLFISCKDNQFTELSA